MAADKSSDSIGLLFTGWRKRSDGKSDFVVSSNIIILSQWCTCGVMMNRSSLLPVFNTSLSQKEMWSVGTLCQPLKFNFELRSLQSNLAFGALRNSIPPL